MCMLRRAVTMRFPMMVLLAFAFRGVVAQCQQPPGAPEALAGLTSQPSTHTAVTFDRDTLQSMLGGQPYALNSVTVESYRYREPAFYVPEALAALGASYAAAGWKHLVEANVAPREQVSPVKPVTDLCYTFAVPKSTTSPSWCERPSR